MFADEPNRFGGTEGGTTARITDDDDALDRSAHMLSTNSEKDISAHEEDGITWREVYKSCCQHTCTEWARIVVAVEAICLLLYFFLVGLELLGSSAKIIGACTAGQLLGDETNPFAALMIGIIATVLLQSSSTTTSIIVSLVGSDTIAARQAIYMIMGANIGTSVTSTIVALGQVGDSDQLELAFAGATVHDMFNLLTVIVLLPIEAATGYLYYLTKTLVTENSVRKGNDWEGPVKRFVTPLSARIIVANKDVIKGVAKGDRTCDSFYPINCQDPSNPTKDTCTVGLIGCDSKTNRCPALFESSATQRDDEVAGAICFFLGLVMILLCLIGLITILQRMFVGPAIRVVDKATKINEYLAMAIGTAITMLVQSSSITTAILTPFVGLDVIKLEQMLPLTLGANLGTTVTALLASLVSDRVESLQVALAHLFFNLTGIVIWYPIPCMRRVPLKAARNLGKATRVWRGFPVVYIIVVFFLIPFGLLGLAVLFEQGSKSFDVLGVVLVVCLVGLEVWVGVWWFGCGGKQRTINCLQRRQRRAEAVERLPERLYTLETRVTELTARSPPPVSRDA